MSDYIDRDLLLAEIKELKKSPWYNGCNGNYERIIRSDAIGVVVDLCIRQVPAADVQEVRHGQWIDVPLNVYNDNYKMNKYNKRTKCSVCTYAMPYEYPRYHICPNCGAKMDGGKEDDLG